MHNFKRNCSKHQETMPSVQFLPLQIHGSLPWPERTFSVEWTVESRRRCLFLYLTSPHPSTCWFKNVEPVENKGFNLVPLSGSQWAPIICWPWGQHWIGVGVTSSLISAHKSVERFIVTAKELRGQKCTLGLVILISDITELRMWWIYWECSFSDSNNRENEHQLIHDHFALDREGEETWRTKKLLLNSLTVVQELLRVKKCLAGLSGTLSNFF